MKNKISKWQYIVLALIIVNTLMYFFKIRIPFNNKLLEIAYGAGMTAIILYVLYLDRRER